MTGYGHAKTQKENLNLEASIRSVNGRFFEVRFHIPKEYLPFEAEIKKIIQDDIERGTVDLFISRRENLETLHRKVLVNKTLAKEYHKAFVDLGKALKTTVKPHPELIARYPDVLHVDQSPVIDPKEKQWVLKVVKEAAKKCRLEREREGQSIRNDIEMHLKKLGDLVSEIREYRSEVNESLAEKFKQKLQSRMKELGLSDKLDDQRISQEIVMQLERSDINEELQRLTEHLGHYVKIFSQEGGVGKKLDFYTQELLREVNTIGSKSNVSKLTTCVVEAKTIIEKLREQVQNIE